MLLAEMTAAELAIWEDVYIAEYLGADREYYMMATIEAATINWAGKTRVSYAEPANPVDLMPFLPQKPPAPEPTPEELSAKLHLVLGGMAARGGQFYVPTKSE